MKKIYITDLDHTFLRSDLTISDYTKKIWNSYGAHSIMSIATARTYKKTMQFLEGVTLNAPMILLDGALIATEEKKIIDTKFISGDVADAIIDEGAKLGIFPFVITLADANLNELFLHSEQLNAVQEQVLKRYSKDDNLTPQKNLRAMRDNFKIVYMGDETLLRELDARLQELFGEELKYVLAPEAYMGCYFLTILHKNADKAHGIRSVSEYVGFDLGKLTVFGDNFNDIGMFALAANAVAVNNAQEGVKQKAHITLPHTNDEDGVARYLESLIHG
jgi:5-amino-6-(5-phospho-D-ribitylamino)uracil phosphatase